MCFVDCFSFFFCPLPTAVSNIVLLRCRVYTLVNNTRVYGITIYTYCVNYFSVYFIYALCKPPLGTGDNVGIGMNIYDKDICCCCVSLLKLLLVTGVTMLAWV